MLNYLDSQNQLHTRLVDFTPQQYLFVLQIVLGERIEVAYANTFDTQEFKRNIPSEDEEEYLATVRKDAQVMLETQECQQLKDEFESLYQSDVQEKASTLEDYKFTGSDVQKLLNNLLHDRSADLSEASVRDILSLIKSMYDSGALDSGDSFTKHFITIPRKFDALCTNCNHEFYLTEGIDIRCPHCGQVYRWDESQNRFFPLPAKL